MFATKKTNNSQNTINMKKTLFTIIGTFMAFGLGYAQALDGIIAQPTHVIGRRMNASGEVIKTLSSDFTYDENGRPHTFEFPSYELHTTYIFNGEFFREESTWHDHGHPIIQERLVYTYENDKIKTIGHYWDYENPNELWVYTYGDDGRLARKDYKELEYDSDFYRHYLYEYENGGKTKIQNYWTSWPSQGMRLRQTIVYDYDDEYRLHTKLVEAYDADGELTSSTLDTYTYTANGKQDTQITQVLTEGDWVNSHIMRYVYNENEQVTEQQDGSWSSSTNDWNINRRVVFELSEDGTTYTVSFYKKSGDEWVWDMFNNQTILFGDALKNQERTLRFYEDEIGNGHGMINQFEMTFIYTEEPIYMGANENGQTKCCVYPNPGKENITIEAPTEDAVIRFYNQQGQLILARPFDFSTQINTGNWPSGLYFWEIWHEYNRASSGKWVKE